ADTIASDRVPLVSDAPVVRSVTSQDDGPSLAGFGPDAGAPGLWDRGDRALDRLAGTLVHRLFQRGWATPPPAADAVAHLARLVRSEELVDVPDHGRFLSDVAAAFLRLAGRSDVRRWLAQGRAYYEVPFSYAPADAPGVIVRGSIDCLVARADGSLQVLEFKTGSPRPEHAGQLDTYLQAVRQAFSGADVTGELVYPGPGE
ncbi:MAG: PD-(D/E)XK nuclease family protein, partial [Acidobacteria bacterium]|nr:PD-(D/E)XK nuclease family protein [Acidobacteriota bacterium]